MSSSYLKRSACALPLALAAAPVLHAQQVYFIPKVEVGAEWHSNRELTPNPALEDSSTAYKATLEGLWGRATPRSETEVRPRVVLQEFPDRQGVDPAEYFLDLRSTYRTLKSEWSLLGEFSQQDTYNAEFGTARGDDFDPENPDVDEVANSGIVFVGETRTRLEVEPSVRYALSPRTSLGLLANYQFVDYDSNLPDQRVGFTSPYVQATIIRQVGQRTELSVGPYYTHYEADNDLSESDSYGALINLRHRVTEVTYFTFGLSVERSEETRFTPLPVEESVTSWGFEFAGFRRGRVGSLRYSLGRFLQPSSVGDRREIDQLRIQYNRPLSPLFSVYGAVRLSQDRSIGDDRDGRDRDRALLEAGMSRLITPTFYISGGYRYAWLDRQDAPRSADNHNVFISFGFTGRDPRRR